MLFPLPLTPVTETKHPSGNSTSMFFRLCSSRVAHRDPRLARGSPDLGYRDGPLARQVLAGDRTPLGEHLLHRARHHDLTAVLTRTRADVDHVVGDADGLLVVLDDDHGVADVAQAQQGVDQSLVVALVETDRRFVEHVEHTDEAAADLRRQPDPLRLAARERGRRPVQ